MVEQAGSYSNRSDANPFSSLSTGIKTDIRAAAHEEDSRSHSICVVSASFENSNDAGRFAFNLARTLANAGHSVTCLIHSDLENSNNNSALVRRLQECNIELANLPVSEPGLIMGTPEQIRAYETFNWLKHRKFDLVHIPEECGIGYYALLAKHQGLYFQDTLFCVNIKGPGTWIRHWNSQQLNKPEDLVVDFIERESVALADVATSPSATMVEWLRLSGWRFPQSTFVLQNPLTETNLLNAGDKNSSELSTSRNERLAKIDEIVFFESLDKRNGLDLFCDVIDQLSAVLRSPVTITFLGKNSIVDGNASVEYIQERAKNWALPWQIIDEQDDESSMAYLLSGNRIAVIPSLQDSSPYAVLNCLAARVPFLCSAVGNFSELIISEDRETATFEPRKDKLYAKLIYVIANGARAVRPAGEVTTNGGGWQEWHRTLFREIRPTLEATFSPGDRELPLVTVCMPHFNRPDYLRHAIDSIVAQDYPKIEVIVVDDGSTDALAIAALAEFDSELTKRGWSLLRQEHSSAGAARNLAARKARGEYILFMDDDNFAKPNEISTFVNVALNTKADVLTCFADHFSGNNAPAPDQLPDGTSVFVGAASAAGIFDNVFGDTNALVRRETFFKIGGHVDDASTPFEDWEFYARAIRQGAKLEVVPESLFWYRQTDNNRSRTVPRFAGYKGLLRAYQSAVPTELQPLISVAQGMYLSNRERARQDILKSISLRHRVWQLTQRYEELQAQHQSFCAEVAEKLSTRRETIGQLESKINELTTEVEQRGQVLDKKRADLKHFGKEFETLHLELQQRNAIVEEKTAETEALAAEIIILKGRLSSMSDSRSWKVTAPLRALQSKIDYNK